MTIANVIGVKLIRSDNYVTPWCSKDTPGVAERYRLRSGSDRCGSKRHGFLIRSRRLPTLAIAAALATTHAAYPAADTGAAHLLNLSLDELGSIKVDTVFAASKFTQKITDAPSSVTIITRDEIQRFGYRTLGDIVRAVRSFDVTFDRNYSYTGVRGFNSLGDYGSRVLLLIDGHRMNDPIYDVTAVGTEGLLDVDLIEQVDSFADPAQQFTEAMPSSV